MFAFRIAAAALIVASPVLAQQTKKPAPARTLAPKPAPAKPGAAKPKPAPAKPKPSLITIPPLSHDEKDGFSVLQVAVPDSAKFVAEWKLGGGGKSATTKTVANQPLFTFLIFRGCKANADGKCDIVADFVITRPDGTINDENKGVVVWNKAAPADPKKPYIGDGALGYGVDEEGPFGDYRVVATTTDRVANITLTTELTLTIASDTKPATSAKQPEAKPDAPRPTDPAPAATSPADPAPAEPAPASREPATTPSDPAQPPAK